LVRLLVVDAVLLQGAFSRIRSIISSSAATQQQLQQQE